MPRQAHIDSSFFVCTRFGFHQALPIVMASPTTVPGTMLSSPVIFSSGLSSASRPVSHRTYIVFDLSPSRRLPSHTINGQIPGLAAQNVPVIYQHDVSFFLSFPYLRLGGITLWVTGAHRTSFAVSKNGEESANSYRAISAFILRFGPMVKFELLRVKPEPVNGVLVAFWSEAGSSPSLAYDHEQQWER